MIEIPKDRLPPDVLLAIIGEFIHREGTDYGVSEVALEDKVGQVKKQIDRGDVLITFDQATESCNLVSRIDFQRYQQQQQQ